jgi:hypothetical protein
MTAYVRITETTLLKGKESWNIAQKMARFTQEKIGQWLNTERKEIIRRKWRMMLGF